LLAGAIAFNGDGSLNNVTAAAGFPALYGPGAPPSPVPLQIPWSGGATTSSVTFDLGTEDRTDGLAQSASSFTLDADVDGGPVGNRTGIYVNDAGKVIATYSNGQTRELYQVPLATFSNPNALMAVNGTAYVATTGSGPANFVSPGEDGAGTIIPSALENSTSISAKSSRP
jgi:flagellar hook protein FlgE